MAKRRRWSREPKPLDRITDVGIIKRFNLNLHVVGAPHGMWIWKGNWKTNDGYGMMRVFGVPQYVHRVSYAIHVGPIPGGMTINHMPPSEGLQPHYLNVNPDHLELATNSDNAREGATRRHRGDFEGNLDEASFQCPRCRGVMIAGERLKQIRTGLLICLHCGHEKKDRGDDVPF